LAGNYITASTALSIVKATENINNIIDSENPATNLRMSNLEKLIKNVTISLTNKNKISKCLQ
jgi:hypothetical protein